MDLLKDDVLNNEKHSKTVYAIIENSAMCTSDDIVIDAINAE